MLRLTPLELLSFALRMPADTAPIHLQVLGPPIVRPVSNTESVALLCEPRPLALLVFLVLARPRGMHARDALLTLFWPDAGVAQARQGLRNALHAIRHAAGHDLFVAAGHTMLGVHSASVHCDLILFEAEAARGNCDIVNTSPDVLLDGFHVTQAPAFDQWMEQERTRYRDMLRRTLWRQVEQCITRGDGDRAVDAARRAHTLDSGSERSLRRLIEVLCACGDRASALREYEKFSYCLRDEFGAVPSAATLAVIERLRCN